MLRLPPRSIGSPEGLLEERRLAYVAFTRARDLLTLSRRARLKTNPRAPTTPSRFLALPEGVVERILHNGCPYASRIADRTVIVLTRCALDERARAFLHSSNVTAVDWGGLEAISQGRPVRAQRTFAPTGVFGAVAAFRGPQGGGFELESPFEPTGDQPQAIRELVSGLDEGRRFQTLLGATGTGKTFVMANLIQSAQKPTLVLAPNKMLAAQLCNELRDFFPRNAVEYFVSYYDFFRPEAYMAVKDVFVEKASVVNQQIDRMRHSATRSVPVNPCDIIGSYTAPGAWLLIWWCFQTALRRPSQHSGPGFQLSPLNAALVHGCLQQSHGDEAVLSSRRSSTGTLNPKP